jgi:putative DNA primase/helicase
MSERIDFNHVKTEATGKWSGILESLGIKVGDGNHTECPICQKPKFRYDNRDNRGGWVCVCGAGDGWKLITETLNVDFATAVEMVAPLIGIVAEDKNAKPKEKTITADRAREIFKGSVKADHGNPAGLYLRNRGLNACPETLWYNPSLFHVKARSNYPAMVACVTNKGGQVSGLHQTFITVSGAKANVKETKLVTSNIEKIDLTGRAIRLFPPEHGCLGIAEGIETALAAYEMHGIPTWAAVNANWLIGWEPPEGIPLRKIYIFGDNDLSFTGHSSAYQLANKMTVRRKIEVEVMIPEKAGNDWLDDFNERSRGNG